MAPELTVKDIDEHLTELLLVKAAMKTEEARQEVMVDIDSWLDTRLLIAEREKGGILVNA